MAGSATVGILRVLLTANSAEFDSAMKRVSDTAKSFSKDLGSIGKQATSIGTALTKTLTVPLVALGAGAIKAAMDFESSFAGVRKTVDATEPEFAQLAQGLRNMAKEIPVNVNELNKVAEAAGQLGIKKDDILQFTRTMADLGVTTNLTADEAATATAQIQNIFGAAGKDVDRFGATLVGLGNAGASTEKDIIAMGLRIAGAGHQVGLTQGQVLAFASSLSSVGINAEAGGSAISRVFLKINDAVASGGPPLAEFARISGMSSKEFKQAFETDAAGATTAFIAGLGRLKGEGENVNKTLEGVVGKNIILKDTLLRASGAGTLLADNLNLQEKLWQENNALTKEAAERYKTFESQVTVLWNQIKDLGITIGTALLPTLTELIADVKPLVSSLGDMAKQFAELPQPVRATALGFLAITAAAGPVIWGLGQLAISGSAIVGVFAQGALGAKAVGIAFAVLTSPITLVVGAIAALALGWAKFTGDWTRAFDILLPPLGFFRLGVDSLKTALAPYAGIIGDITSIIKNGLILAWNGARDVMVQIKDAVLGPMKAKWDQVTEAVKALVGWIQNQLPDAMRSLQETFNPLLAVESKLREWAGRAKVSIHEVAGAMQTAADASSGAGAVIQSSTLGGANAFQYFSTVAGRAVAPVVAASGATATLGDTTETSGNKVKDATKELREFNNWIGERQMEAAALGIKAQEEFAASVTRTVAVFAPFKATIKSAQDELRALGGSLSDLASGSLLEYGTASTAARKEALEWAMANGAVLAPSIKAVGSAAGEAARTTLSAWQTAMAGLPQAIMGAIQGGGSIIGAAGSQIGTSLMTSFQTKFGPAITAALPFGIGAAVTSLLPTLGALFGPVAQKLAGFFRNIFGGASSGEKEGRAAVAAFEAQLASTLTETQKLEAGNESWKMTVIAIRDAYLAAGRTSEEAMQAAEDLWASSKDGAEATRRVIAEIQRLMNAIPDNKTIDVDVKYHDNMEPVTDPGFATGTMGRIGKFFGNFGAGMSTALHGVEAVLRPQDAVPFSLATLGSMMPSMPSMPSFAGMGGTTNSTANNLVFVAIPVEAAGDTYRITREVMKSLPSSIALDESGVRSGIERVIADYTRTYGRG